ncbi:methyltransferase domain-containing protein [Streptomyces canus]|uniref:methyltransferase domain-containing protein n=1 Tax=Streptomyces canus TaxID=58343 RepID=UPI00340F94AF
MTSIEIGGGTLVQPGWVNLDSRNGVGEWQRMAQDTPWPTLDNSVDAIRASHVMEHIPAGQDRIDVMNEAHRVLKPGGIFEIIVPLMVGTWHAIADPTHVSFWVKESFHYFDGLFAANADYGIRLWQTLELDVVDGWEGHWKGTPR